VTVKETILNYITKQYLLQSNFTNKTMK